MDVHAEVFFSKLRFYQNFNFRTFVLVWRLAGGCQALGRKCGLVVRQPTHGRRLSLPGLSIVRSKLIFGCFSREFLHGGHLCVVHEPQGVVGLSFSLIWECFTHFLSQILPHLVGDNTSRSRFTRSPNFSKSVN